MNIIKLLKITYKAESGLGVSRRDSECGNRREKKQGRNQRRGAHAACSSYLQMML